MHIPGGGEGEHTVFYFMAQLYFLSGYLISSLATAPKRNWYLIRSINNTRWKQTFLEFLMKWWKWIIGRNFRFTKSRGNVFKETWMNCAQVSNSLRTHEWVVRKKHTSDWIKTHLRPYVRMNHCESNWMVFFKRRSRLTSNSKVNIVKVQDRNPKW